MIQILKKEINSFLNSLIAYIVITVFLTGVGLLMWVFPETSVLNYGYASMSTLFNMGPYVLMFLIPAITMRTFAEEKKTGTIELLLTKPVTDFQIILGKYLGCLVLVLFTLLPTLIYYFSIYYLGNPVGNIDTPGVMGSYIGLFLLGAVFCAIGVLASTITENQIIAFILATFLCFIFFSGINSFAQLIPSGDYANQLEQLGILYHYNSMSKGLIDSRNLVYFFSIITTMLMGTNLVMASRKW